MSEAVQVLFLFLLTSLCEMTVYRKKCIENLISDTMKLCVRKEPDRRKIIQKGKKSSRSVRKKGNQIEEIAHCIYVLSWSNIVTEGYSIHKMVVRMYIIKSRKVHFYPLFSHPFSGCCRVVEVVYLEGHVMLVSEVMEECV